MNIGSLIINWYKRNKRDLPWRNTNDPYTIWVSEIIMQQTRINQGTPYFTKFMVQFPSVFDLAKAPEEKVLLVWQGLGYYSRARNMHQTAKIIANDFQGEFPGTASDLRKLKGIGDYTAAAISSFCFNENIPAIDGNVNRVISRIFEISEPVNTSHTLKQIKEISSALVEGIDAASYNQGMMDLGATICLPKNPNCHNCPVKEVCLAFKNNLQNQLPVKNKIGAIKSRYFTYLVFLNNDQLLIQKRNKKDIWKGLHEFPLIETEKKTTLAELVRLKQFKELTRLKNITTRKIIEPPAHKLSHQTLYSQFIIFDTHSMPQIPESIIVNINDIHDYAFPTLIEKQLKSIFI